jgi:hypothetical protein
MIRQYAKLVVTVILLGLAAFGADTWQGRLLQSAAEYQSPLQESISETTNPLPPIGSRVVLVIISGLSAEVFNQLELTNFERLRESGANVTVQSQPPTYPASTWLTIVSGAGPTLTNEPLLYPRLGQIQPAAISTLFSLSHAQGKDTALLGQPLWQELLPAGSFDRAFFTSLPDRAGDQAIIDRLRDIFEDEQLALVVVHFNGVNFAAETLGGPLGEGYQAALEQLDRQLGVMLNLLDPDRTTVVITSDHGHIERGGYGGHDETVINLPLILYGRSVIPGDYSPVKQSDIAPTIAALLGLNVPATNEGRPLLEMLQVSERERAIIRMTMARQQFHLTEAYLTSLAQTPPETDELDKAQRFFDNGNYDGTDQLSQLLMTQAAQLRAEADQTRLAAERTPRFWVSLAILLFVILFSLWRRSDLFIQALLAAVVVVGIYHILYRIEDWPYSFSAMTSVPGIWLDVGRRMAISWLIGLAFFWLLLILQQMGQTSIILRSIAELSFFVAVGFLAPALYGYWQHGFQVTWHFPSTAHLYWHYTALLQGFWGIGLGILLSPILLPLNHYIQKWMADYQHKQFVKLQTRSTKT